VPEFTMQANVANYWSLWVEERDFFHRMCMRWLRGNRSDVEDVLGKGAINGFEYVRGHPEAVQRFRPWMLKILYHLAIDALRGHARTTELTARDGGDVAACSRDVPDRSVFRGQLAASIAGIVDHLPPRLHEVFTLRFIEHMHYDEISRVLMISTANARKRIQLVRQLLRVELAVFVC
jgi:RNA polymerase sigma factor (sigma-70 family)